MGRSIFLSMLLGLLILLGSCSSEQLPNTFWTPHQGFYPLKADDYLVFLTRDSSNTRLSFYHTEHKNDIKHWDDRDSLIREVYYGLSSYYHAPFLALPFGKRILCFNLHTQTLAWSIEKDRSITPFLEGMGDTLVNSFQTNTGDGVVELRNISNGQLIYSYTYPSKQAPNRVFRTPQLITTPSGTALVGSVIDHDSKSGTDANIITWHQTNWPKYVETPVYQGNTKGLGVTRQGLLHQGDLLFVCGDRLARFNPSTAALSWEISLPGSVITSEPYLDSLLYLAFENEQLAAIDPTHGTIMWTTAIGGFPSAINSSKQGLYLVSGSDGQLYEINRQIQNSTIIDTLQPPPPYNRHLYLDDRHLILKKMDTLHLLIR